MSHLGDVLSQCFLSILWLSFTSLIYLNCWSGVKWLTLLLHAAEFIASRQFLPMHWWSSAACQHHMAFHKGRSAPRHEFQILISVKLIIIWRWRVLACWCISGGLAFWAYSFIHLCSWWDGVFPAMVAHALLRGWLITDTLSLLCRAVTNIVLGIKLSLLSLWGLGQYKHLSKMSPY